MCATAHLKFDPDTGEMSIFEMVEGDHCVIDIVADPAAPGGWGGQCAEIDCDGECRYERSNVYDPATGALRESVITCCC